MRSQQAGVAVSSLSKHFQELASPSSKVRVSNMDPTQSSVEVLVSFQSTVVGRKSVPSSSLQSTVVGKKSAAGGRSPCLCSPTTHAGSFRCRLHRSMAAKQSSAVKSNSISSSTCKGAVITSNHNSLQQEKFARRALQLAISRTGTVRQGHTFTSRPSRLSKTYVAVPSPSEDNILPSSVAIPSSSDDNVLPCSCVADDQPVSSMEE